MARLRTKLQWISNDSSRRATFRKRRKNIMKKVSELSTLCGVQACVIIFGEGESKPEVWPSVPEATAVLERMGSLPQDKHVKTMMNQADYLASCIEKTSKQISEIERHNDEIHYDALVFECLEKGPEFLASLDLNTIFHLQEAVEATLMNVRHKLGRLQEQAGATSSSPSHATAGLSTTKVMMKEDGGNEDKIKSD